MKRSIRVLWAMLVAGAATSQGQDFFELPPIHYSATASKDKVALLARKIEEGKWNGGSAGVLKFLKALLDELDVPEESQVLVFSKTSLQNSLISHDHPRAIYFSMDTYVGWVPGGKIEVIAMDDNLGPVFYTIDPPVGSTPPRVVRATDSCLQCHATSRTSGVPGMFVRSVVPDKNGHPVLSAGTSLVTDHTPLRERWGGWYVSGTTDEGHLGNRWLAEGEETGLAPRASSLANLSSLIDTRKYLRPTSDVVALMVLEHQCHTHNLMTKAKMTYERAVYFQKSYSDADLDSEKGMAWKTADSSAKEIVEAFLFRGEIDLGGNGVEGSEDFVEMFEGRGVGSKTGKKLREFRLYGRLFRYRCSYMIHSTAFRILPDAVKERVFHHLRQALNDAEAGEMSQRERGVIRSILEETVPGFKKES